MNTRSIPEVLEDLVNAGPAVKDFLKATGIKGQVDSPQWCPVANYIREETGKSHVYALTKYLLVNGRAYKMPYNVHRFIANFDAGWYPDLVEQWT